MNQTTETPYVETEALLAALNEDADRLDGILDDMLPGERLTLMRAANVVAAAAFARCERCGRDVREGRFGGTTNGERGGQIHLVCPTA